MVILMKIPDPNYDVEDSFEDFDFITEAMGRVIGIAARYGRDPVEISQPFVQLLKAIHEFQVNKTDD